ncbi:ARM repeat-containing protein [Ascodesmis nigricans]|uniref:Eukaryotic translation initiation factor 3 subunit K n=1 Tax=Ascodesmis nigricans TaxID=341454 RepID=A0A4S2N2I5_9PEZI|nr:ARM repeat-containing protein [Ascodesmis nigricans]
MAATIQSTTTPIPLDSRPEHIENILGGLDRYNPETVSVFQDYVQYQCENKTYDCLANLALLKLYQFNPHLTREETITNVLVKALTMFPGPDFSLCLHLLPPNILDPAISPEPLADAVRKLTHLNTLLESASYREFWNTYEADDLYADLVADCAGFEDTMRDMIALQTGAVAREIRTEVVSGWLNLGEEELKAFGERLGWKVEGDVVKLPLNRENEAKTTVFRENVTFNQFQGVVKRAYEQAA